MLTNGIVEAKQDGKMTIRIEEDEGVCETCAIRAFCKKRDCDGNQIVLNDRDGIGVGDPVNVEENRGILMKTSLLAYGVPLLFFIAGILLGTLIPPGAVRAELIQFACGIAGLLIGGVLGRSLAKRLSRKIDTYFTVRLNKDQ